MEAKRTIRKLLSVAVHDPDSVDALHALRKAQELLSAHHITIDEVYGQAPPSYTQRRIGVGQLEERSQRQWLRAVQPHMTMFQIVPDASVQTGVNIERLLRTVHDMHTDLLARFWWDRGVVYERALRITWRIVYTHDAIRFYIAAPIEHEKNIRQALDACWPKTAICASDDKLSTGLSTVVGELALKKHFFQSLLANRAQSAPMPSLLALKVDHGETAIVDMSIVPIADWWQRQAQSARYHFRRGADIMRLPRDVKDGLLRVGDFINDGILEKAMELTDRMMGAQPSELKNGERHLRNVEPATERKTQHEGFHLHVRLAASGTSTKSATRTVKRLFTAFQDTNLDNEWEMSLVRNPALAIRQIERHEVPVKVPTNILSIPELTQFLQLPSGAMQAEDERIEAISRTETSVPAILTQGGMYLGDVTHKRRTTKVYQPITNIDELVNTHIVIAPPGQGKTRGFAANWMVQAYQNGFGAIGIDAAKGELGDELEQAIGKGNVLRLRFGKEAYALDWREALQDTLGRSRLTHTAIDFFSLEDDMGGQTARFLRSGIMALQDARVAEVVELYRDDRLLAQAIDRVPDGIHRDTLAEFASYKTDMRRKIMSPIYNRLDTVMGDEYIMRCMESRNGLDMVELTSKPRMIICDLPDGDMSPGATDIIVNLLLTKLDLAMRLRERVYGKQAIFPFFIIQDEPHKYLRSTSLWTSAIVEARKHRFGYVWLFHYWEQLPSELQLALKNASPHYHLYAGADSAFQALKSRISPFTVDEAMQLPTHHAINILRAGNQAVKPFIASMAKPPSNAKG